ncbi:hypothetical protein B0T21DRAFT_343432 [Apiosordaria backusii]|uniref:Uncharacterized protein n=1 Tax=Apiosordaria backusii TaxID=314023 RepID=A0AA40EYK4_9PEZI|nr:hypothetical protein B0T21DRAFT_343432 [Apiosordaria backusii]
MGITIGVRRSEAHYTAVDVFVACFATAGEMDEGCLGSGGSLARRKKRKLEYEWSANGGSCAAGLFFSSRWGGCERVRGPNEKTPRAAVCLCVVELGRSGLFQIDYRKAGSNFQRLRRWAAQVERREQRDEATQHPGQRRRLLSGLALPAGGETAELLSLRVANAMQWFFVKALAEPDGRILAGQFSIRRIAVPAAD